MDDVGVTVLVKKVGLVRISVTVGMIGQKTVRALVVVPPVMILVTVVVGGVMLLEMHLQIAGWLDRGSSDRSAGALMKRVDAELIVAGSDSSTTVAGRLMAAVSME